MSFDDTNDSVPSVVKDKEWLNKATRLDKLADEKLEKAKQLRKQCAENNKEYRQCCEEMINLRLETDEPDSIPTLEFCQNRCN